MRVPFRASLGLWLWALCLAWALWGCAPAGKFSAATVDAAPGLDSLKAKFNIELIDGSGKSRDFDGVLFSVPGKRYRMELMGPLGIGVASLLWTETEWRIVFPTEKLYMRGAGYMVGLLDDPAIPFVNIHQVARFFEGVLEPRGWTPEEESDSAGMHLVSGHDAVGVRWIAFSRDGRLEKLTHRVRDGQEETLVFGDVKKFENREIPSKIEFLQNGKRSLVLTIRKITHGKPFSGGTWRLNVPKSYRLAGE